jgi:hypothetical protein
MVPSRWGRLYAVTGTDKAFSTRAEAEAHLATLGKAEPKVMIFNATDGIYAYPTAVSEIKANQLIAEMRARFAVQGYYKTASGERIAPEAVEYTLEAV